MKSMRNCAFALMAVLLLFSTTAQAADDLNLSVERFLPSPHKGDFLSVQGSTIGKTLDWQAGVLFNWSAGAMGFVDRNDVSDDIIDGRFGADLMGSLSIFEYGSIGIAMPLYFYNMVGDENVAFSPGSGGPIDRSDVEGFTWGDLRLALKGRVFDARKSMFGLAFGLDLSFPTGKPDAFASDGGVTVLPRIIGDFYYEGWRAAINVGYRWREDYSLRWLKVQPEFLISAAVSAPVIKDVFEIIGEIDTATRISKFFNDAHNDFVEARLAARYHFDVGVSATLGGGGSFIGSWGAPEYRIFAGVAYTPPAEQADSDNDGIADESDKCPTLPEDRDGFEDRDGCPDPDNDGDGIPDVSDQCPNDKEDLEGFQDEDGCPDPDNDGDGILDREDGCSNQAEDFDNFQDEDGCPEPDNDGDGIIDTADKCPNEPETVNGCADSDGCPEEAHVCVTDDKIVVIQRIYFKTARSIIEKRSYPILDEVAEIIINTPSVKRIRVEGHTDDKGDAIKNMKLSKARGRAVMRYLIKAGVSRKRLTYAGYGETQPIESNETEEGRQRNRRVEFTILDLD